jgi:hypothetical protein
MRPARYELATLRFYEDLKPISPIAEAVRAIAGRILLEPSAQRAPSTPPAIYGNCRR